MTDIFSLFELIEKRTRVMKLNYVCFTSQEIQDEQMFKIYVNEISKLYAKMVTLVENGPQAIENSENRSLEGFGSGKKLKMVGSDLTGQSSMDLSVRLGVSYMEKSLQKNQQFLGRIKAGIRGIVQEVDRYCTQVLCSDNSDLFEPVLKNVKNLKK